MFCLADLGSYPRQPDLKALPTAQWVVYRYRHPAGRPDERDLPPIYRRFVNPCYFHKLFSCLMSTYDPHEHAVPTEREVIVRAMLMVLAEVDGHRDIIALQTRVRAGGISPYLV